MTSSVISYKTSNAQPGHFSVFATFSVAQLKLLTSFCVVLKAF